MRHRNNIVVVHLNDKELANFNKNCVATGLPREVVLRELIKGCVVRPKRPDSYIPLVRELSAIGNNINQIAHCANYAGSVSSEQIKTVTDLMRDVWRAVQKNY